MQFWFRAGVYMEYRLIYEEGWYCKGGPDFVYILSKGLREIRIQSWSQWLKHPDSFKTHNMLETFFTFYYIPPCQSLHSYQRFLLGNVLNLDHALAVHVKIEVDMIVWTAPVRPGPCHPMAAASCLVQSGPKMWAIFLKPVRMCVISHRLGPY